MPDSDRELVAQRAERARQDQIRNAAEQQREAELADAKARHAAAAASVVDRGQSPEAIARAAHIERSKQPLAKLQREAELGKTAEAPPPSSSIPGLNAAAALEGADENLDATGKFYEYHNGRRQDWSGDLKNR